MMHLRCPESNQNWPLFWFELAGVSWSEFAAGTLRAQLGYLEGESGRLNFAETRVVSVPGEGLKPSRGKSAQDFNSCAFFVGPAWMKMAGLYLPESGQLAR